METPEARHTTASGSILSIVAVDEDDVHELRPVARVALVFVGMARVGGEAAAGRELPCDALHAQKRQARLLRAHAFASPSAAAAVVFAGNKNGRLAWRDKDTGMTYKKWQESQVKHADNEHIPEGANPNPPSA